MVVNLSTLLKLSPLGGVVTELADLTVFNSIAGNSASSSFNRSVPVKRDIRAFLSSSNVNSTWSARNISADLVRSGSSRALANSSNSETSSLSSRKVVSNLVVDRVSNLLRVSVSLKSRPVLLLSELGVKSIVASTSPFN